MESTSYLTPFYFLKCEYEETGAWRTTDISEATCTARVFGKNESGETVVVELFRYQPDFFVSFRNRAVCKRTVKGIKDRLKRYIERLTRSDCGGNVPVCHIKGIETAVGYSSLVIYKDHQDPCGKEDYGNTSLNFTYRVYVRCFSHIRSAIREILETARDVAVECGDYTGLSTLKRDVHFYESSLDANVRLSERLKLRPCQWCWLDMSACEQTSVTTETTKKIHRFTYDFLRHVNNDVLKKEGRIEFVRLPFVEVSEELENKMPPPVSVLSFDIECLANDIDTFPTPDVCGIIQIAAVIATDSLNRPEYNGENGERVCRRLYTVGECDVFDEVTTVKCFKSERDMLITFCWDLVADDPDIITGYYIENFDFPFLFARLSVHGLRPELGRLGLLSSCAKSDKGESSQASKRYTSYMPKSNFTTIGGRIIFDACVFVRKEYSMRSYTLNAVSEHFLKSRKEDVHYTQIPVLFESGPAGRAVLGRYCTKDAQLVVDLVFHLQAFVIMSERCKVFNTTLDYMLDRGQQVRIISMLLKWCSARKTLINDCTTADNVFYKAAESDMRERLNERNAIYKSKTHDTLRRAKKRRIIKEHTDDEDDDDDDNDDKCDSGVEEEEEEGEEEDDEEDHCREVRTTNRGVKEKDTGGKTKNSKYDGAVVIEPKRGLYHDPIVCLDYASLYPSIMIAYNLCYSTMILNTKHGREAIENGTAIRSPVGHYFLKSEIKKGVLPSILETLIETRTAVRRRMNGLNRDSVDYMLLNGQQGALKIAANSIYGATGCQNGKLYFLQIPSSVTAYGREMIIATKEFIEKEYHDREVVYGDTDSVMVRMTGWSCRDQHKKHHHLWDCTDAGNEMADSVTKLIDRAPIKLQFETVYLPFLLANKKRYAAGVYKSLDKVKSVAEEEGVVAAQKALNAAERQIVCKGLEVVRRDNCLFAKNTLQKTIDMIMAMERPENVVNTLRHEVLRLLRGDVNIRDLVISKEWTKRTKNPTPHDCLAQKMMKRNPGEAPQLGDRIQYIVVESSRKSRTEKLFDRAEDPLYVLEHGLAVDYVYYANNQLLNPLVNVLITAMPQCTKEEIKDMLWPSAGENIPERPSKKRAAKRPCGTAKYSTAPPGNKLITSFFTATTQATTSSSSSSSSTSIAITKNNKTTEVDDIEEICMRLERDCMICKNGDDTATASCKNRDCALLYERYTQKRRILTAGYDVTNKGFAKVLGLN